MGDPLPCGPSGSAVLGDELDHSTLAKERYIEFRLALDAATMLHNAGVPWSEAAATDIYRKMMAWIEVEDRENVLRRLGSAG